MSFKNASDVGSNASDEWLQTADHSWVQCPYQMVGENTYNVGSNAPDGQRMIGPVADNVASKIGRRSVTKGWHGANYLGAKKKIPCYVFERHGTGLIGLTHHQVTGPPSDLRSDLLDQAEC